MSVIRATVTDQVLKITEAPLVASGGQNEVKVTFTFCEKWEGFAKTATFYRDEDNVYHMVLDENNTCTVPWEVYYESGTFYFGVFGDKDDVRRTSSTARYRVKKGAVTDETMPSDPTPEVYDQIMSKLGEMEQNGADGKSIFYCNLNASGEEWTTDLSTINIGDSRIKIGDMFITANGLLYEVTVIVAGIVIGKLLAVNGDHAEGGPVTDEQIESAVERYLEENPVEVPSVNLSGYAKTEDIPTDEHINGLIDTALEGFDVPSGGGGIEVTGAEVGQTIVVKAVDENGKPTEWECADFPSDGSGGSDVFAGKTASFYGDSLTEANYHCTKGYHSWVKDLLGLAYYKNYGNSGYKVSDVYNKVNSITDAADVIFVMCGVNDQSFSVPIGVLGDTTTGTTYGALNLLCSLLKQKYPTSIIVFITPHYQTKYPHSEGITSYEVSKAVREVCEKYAIPVYDNFVLSGIYSTNLSTFTTDNCHWNDTAHEMVGKNLARFMVNTFRYVHGNTAGGDTHTHRYTETVTTAATCTTAGVKTFTCECGDKYTQSIPATGHNYVDGVCSVCGAADMTVQPEYPAKTVEVTGKWKDGEWHISLYATADSLPSITGGVEFGVDITPLSGFTLTKANLTGGFYEVDIINDLLVGFKQVVSGITPTLVDNGNGTYSVTLNYSLSAWRNAREYWCFPLNLPLAVGDKFTVSDAYIKVGELYYPICAIGGAFAEETCIVTDAE